MSEFSEKITILTVYFSGTAHDIEDTGETDEDKECPLGSFLYQNTKETETQLKQGFSGTTLTNGIKGFIFGTGLEYQCRSVKQKVIDLLKQGKKVRLNCYGHSRGGIAALMLAQMLGNFDEDLLEINLALVDPVPGNLITSAKKLDIFSKTLANKVKDLSSCRTLKKVLALYTNIPHKDYMFHAPLLPKYPQQAQVEEDVMPGGHSGIQCVESKLDNDGLPAVYIFPHSLITFMRVKEFLSDCGTEFQHQWELFLKPYQKDQAPIKLDNFLYVYIAYDVFYNQFPKAKKWCFKKATRHCHSIRGVTIETDPNKNYVNLHHKSLKRSEEDEEKEGEPVDNADLQMRIYPPHINTFNLHDDDPLPESTDLLFQTFIQEVHNGLSDKSKYSTKGTLLSSYLSEAKNKKFESRKELTHAIRNILALALQRDRNWASFFSTTQSGYVARALLQKPEYAPFAKLILRTAEHTLRYRDLRMFVLGENDTTYFYERNRLRTYNDIFKAASPAEKPSITSDLTTSYFNH
ncbi:MAG: uncharacterized protein K0R24_855 [Gammaproteobacteria bacterium]|jgi:hypothetical protein|nr:uncharacterized protein [Gammaproteobacteria bacterium]